MATKTNGTAVAVAGKYDIAKIRRGLANAKRHAPRGRAEFLRMDKDSQGAWTYGQSATPVSEDDELYVDPDGSVWGWQCWVDTKTHKTIPAKVLGSIIVPIDQPLPAMPDEVPEYGRGWDEMRGISLVLNGKPLTYTTTSMGGLQAIAGFQAEYAAQLDEDETKPVGVITLASDWYKNKTHGGKTYVPIFNVQRWVAELSTEAVEPKPKAKPPVKAAPKAPVRRAR